MANLSMFSLPNRVQYLPVFIYSPEIFFIANFKIKPSKQKEQLTYKISHAPAISKVFLEIPMGSPEM